MEYRKVKTNAGLIVWFTLSLLAELEKGSNHTDPFEERVERHANDELERYLGGLKHGPDTRITYDKRHKTASAIGEHPDLYEQHRRDVPAHTEEMQFMEFDTTKKPDLELECVLSAADIAAAVPPLDFDKVRYGLKITSNPGEAAKPDPIKDIEENRKRINGKAFDMMILDDPHDEVGQATGFKFIPGQEVLYRKNGEKKVGTVNYSRYSQEHRANVVSIQVNHHFVGEYLESELEAHGKRVVKKGNLTYTEEVIDERQLKPKFSTAAGTTVDYGTVHKNEVDWAKDLLKTHTGSPMFVPGKQYAAELMSRLGLNTDLMQKLLPPNCDLVMSIGGVLTCVLRSTEAPPTPKHMDVELEEGQIWASKDGDQHRILEVKHHEWSGKYTVKLLVDSNQSQEYWLDDFKEKYGRLVCTA